MGVYFRPVLAEADPETSKFVFFNFLLILFGDGVTSQPGDFEAIRGPGRVLQPYGGGMMKPKDPSIVNTVIFPCTCSFSTKQKQRGSDTRYRKKGVVLLYTVGYALTGFRNALKGIASLCIMAQ